MSQCRPGAPDPAAQFHLSYALVGVKAGGRRVFLCGDCGVSWDTLDRDESPPTGSEWSPQEDVTETSWRAVNEESLPSEKIVAHPHGFDPNQILIDSLARVNKGQTVWVAVVEIGRNGVPYATSSAGPITYALAAAQALSYETSCALADAQGADSDDEGDSPRSDPHAI